MDTATEDWGGGGGEGEMEGRENSDGGRGRKGEMEGEMEEWRNSKGGVYEDVGRGMYWYYKSRNNK